MGKIRKAIDNIIKRPRLVAVLILFCNLLIDIVYFVICRRVGIVIVINLLLFLVLPYLFFAVYLKTCNYKIATLMMIVSWVVCTMLGFLDISDYYCTGLFVVPAATLIFEFMDYKRIDSRKNLALYACLLLVVFIYFLGVGRYEFGLKAVLFLVISGCLTFASFWIGRVSGVSGVHFGLKKYKKPKDIKKVSVVIPNYNYARYMKERVDSILNQTYPIYELIILDDKSTDDSDTVIKQILDEMQEQHPKILTKYIKNEENSGSVFAQWKKGFDEARGDFVWIAEADDSSNKHFLNAVMQAFDDKKVVLSYTESCTINTDGKREKRDLRDWVDMFGTGHWRKSYVHDGKVELKQVLCVNNTIANVSGVVFRKDLIDYDKYLKAAMKYRLAGDWYFYSKVLMNGKIAYHDESLNYHRMHSAGVTLTTDNFQHYNEILSVQNSIKKDVELSAVAKQRIDIRRRTLRNSFGISEDKIHYNKIAVEDLTKRKKIDDRILLSVIVCAYNAEKYIEACLESVLVAVPEKTEIIVVNDGSSDATPEIVEKMAAEHKSIKMFSKENGGLSSAKNAGLKVAQGRYVIFMDADDEIARGGYELMLKKAIDKDADMVICDMKLVYEDGKVTYAPVYHDRFKDKALGFLMDGLMASSNNKMVKRELFDGIVYPEGKNNEDVAVTPVLLMRAKNIEYIHEGLYYYYQRKGSIQNSGFDEKRLVIFDTCKIAIENAAEVAPEKREAIEGIIVSNQLIVILVYIICDLKNKNKRNKLIELFCKKFNELDVTSNEYVIDYFAMIGMNDLGGYIKNGNPDRLARYVRECKNKEVLNRYIKLVFNIK